MAMVKLPPATKAMANERLIEVWYAPTGGACRMWKTPLVWKAELGTAPDSAFSAQLGNLITYHVISRTYGYPAYVEVRSPRGSLKVSVR